MADARTIVERARRDTRAIEARLKTHPSLQALEARRLAEERLRIFAEQQYHIIESDLRSVALAAARAASPRAREFFLGMLQGSGPPPRPWAPWPAARGWRRRPQPPPGRWP